jgi:hypothetical protein
MEIITSLTAIAELSSDHPDTQDEKIIVFQEGYILFCPDRYGYAQEWLHFLIQVDLKALASAIRETLDKKFQYTWRSSPEYKYTRLALTSLTLDPENQLLIDRDNRGEPYRAGISIHFRDHSVFVDNISAIDFIERFIDD